MKKKYYIGTDFKQFTEVSLFLRKHGIKSISDAKSANQSQYTILVALSDEDLVALKLSTKVEWIRKSNW